MNLRLIALPSLFALTLALAACGDKRPADSGAYSGNLPDAGGGSGGQDTLNTGNIPPSARVDNPEGNVDYSLFQADTVYFAFDSYVIPLEERPKLQAVFSWLSANSGRRLYLAGHTDKRGTAEYNLALGERRAAAVRAYLVGLGADPSALATNSYGADRPAAEGDSEAAYAKNRRVEVGLVKGNAQP